MHYCMTSPVLPSSNAHLSSTGTCQGDLHSPFSLIPAAQLAGLDDLRVNPPSQSCSMERNHVSPTPPSATQSSDHGAPGIESSLEGIRLRAELFRTLLEEVENGTLDAVSLSLRLQPKITWISFKEILGSNGLMEHMKTTQAIRGIRKGQPLHPTNPLMPLLGLNYDKDWQKLVKEQAKGRPSRLSGWGIWRSYLSSRNRNWWLSQQMFLPKPHICETILNQLKQKVTSSVLEHFDSPMPLKKPQTPSLILCSASLCQTLSLDRSGRTLSWINMLSSKNSTLGWIEVMTTTTNQKTLGVATQMSKRTAFGLENLYRPNLNGQGWLVLGSKELNFSTHIGRKNWEFAWRSLRNCSAQLLTNPILLSVWTLKLVTGAKHPYRMDNRNQLHSSILAHMFCSPSTSSANSGKR